MVQGSCLSHHWVIQLDCRERGQPEPQDREKIYSTVQTDRYEKTGKKFNKPENKTPRLIMNLKHVKQQK